MTETRNNAVALMLVLLLAAFLRLYHIERETAWNDEALSLRFLDAPTYAAFADPMFANDHGIRHVPVYFALQYAWSRVFGPSTLSLRMLSVLCSLATAILLYLTTRRLATTRAATAATVLSAVSLPHIFYSQEVRFYALVTLLVMTSVYCFIRAVQKGSRSWWWALFAVDAMLAWTHVFGPLVWLAQGLFLILFLRSSPRTIAWWVAARGTICIAFAAWLWHVRYFIEEGYTKQSTPTWRELVNAFVVYAGGRFEKVDPALYLPTGLSFDLPLTATLGALILYHGANLFTRRGKSPIRETHESFVFTLLWFLVPPLFLFAVSQVWKPFFLFRYTLYCSLGLYAAVGIALDALRPQRLRVALCVLLAVLFAHQLAVRLQPFRPDYRAADAYIRARDPGGGHVFALKELNGVPFRYTSQLPLERIHSFEGVGEWYAASAKSVAEHGHAWLILWRYDTQQIEDYFAQEGFILEKHALPGLPPLYLYRIARDGYSTPPN